MKLIEILVQELPKRGGWPDGANHIATIGYRRVFAYWVGSSSKGRDLNIVSDTEGYVRREQYEAALAASKTEWDGYGLPPVGVECEFKANDGSWGIGTVLCVGKNRIFWLCHEDGDEYTSEVSPREFRPIRSEADRKKEALLSKIASAITGEVPDTGMATAAMYAERVYEAIKSGKIVID